jgi:hypothetical protein
MQFWPRLEISEAFVLSELRRFLFAVQNRLEMGVSTPNPWQKTFSASQLEMRRNLRDELRGSRLNLPSRFRHGGRKHRAFGRKPSSPTSYKYCRHFRPRHHSEQARNGDQARYVEQAQLCPSPLFRGAKPPTAGVQILLSYLCGKCLYIILLGRCQGVVCVSILPWTRLVPVFGMR